MKNSIQILLILAGITSVLSGCTKNKWPAEYTWTRVWVAIDQDTTTKGFCGGTSEPLKLYMEGDIQHTNKGGKTETSFMTNPHKLKDVVIDCSHFSAKLYEVTLQSAGGVTTEVLGPNILQSLDADCTTHIPSEVRSGKTYRFDVKTAFDGLDPARIGVVISGWAATNKYDITCP